jgi:hypothetical protein
MEANVSEGCITSIFRVKYQKRKNPEWSRGLGEFAAVRTSNPSQSCTSEYTFLAV